MSSEATLPQFSVIKSLNDTEEQKEPYIFEVSERNELDNVSGNGFSRGGLEHAIVSIQKLHGLKVSWPHPHDNDRQGQPRRSNYGVPSLIQVCDLSVSEDEEDQVLLQKGTVHQNLTLCGRPASVCAFSQRLCWPGWRRGKGKQHG